MIFSTRPVVPNVAPALARDKTPQAAGDGLPVRYILAQ